MKKRTWDGMAEQALALFVMNPSEFHRRFQMPGPQLDPNKILLGDKEAELLRLIDKSKDFEVDYIALATMGLLDNEYVQDYAATHKKQ